jgi:hypothetical protein
VPDPQYAYTGYATLGYADYADTATDRMLVASPGGSYGIRAIDGMAPVPPPDGRWATAGWQPPPGVPPVPDVPAVPALAEAGAA